MKKVFLEISSNSQQNSCARVSFLIELQAYAWNFIKKETLAQLFFNAFGEISENTFSYKTSPMAASEQDLRNCENCKRNETENNEIRRKA